MMITTNGNVSINSTANVTSLTVNGTAATGNGAVNITAINANINDGKSQDCLSLIAWNDSNIIVSMHNTANEMRGYISGTTNSVSYQTTSDRRLKTNITTIQNAVGILQKLNPVHFTWIADNVDDYGFIAQDVFAVIPQFRNNNNNYTPCNCTGTTVCNCYLNDEPVDKDGKPLYYGLDYGRFTPYLVKGVQEVIAITETQQAQLQQQASEITLLKSQLATQESKVASLESQLNQLLAWAKSQGFSQHF
jgi:hypothetical protein